MTDFFILFIILASGSFLFFAGYRLAKMKDSNTQKGSGGSGGGGGPEVNKEPPQK